MTPRRNQRIERALRRRLAGYWWRELPQPTITVAVRGDAAARWETIAALEQLEQPPAILDLGDDQTDQTPWRTVAACSTTTTVAVVNGGWSPPPGWLDGLARHFSDHSVAAVADDFSLPMGLAAERIDWRTRGAARRVRGLSPEGVIVRAERARSGDSVDEILRGILDSGDAVVVDPSRFRGAVDPPAQSVPGATRDPAQVRPRTQVTVVVPTIARRSVAVERCIRAIEAQDLPRDQIEIILVPNGPGAEHMPYPNGADRVIPLATPSAAVARSEGARAASGELVVFVDDDIELDPVCLRAHVMAQSRTPSITVGPCYPPRPSKRLAEQTAYRWWNQFLARMTRPGHRVSFVDALTGNMGAPPRLFLELGGLDPSFTKSRREDWEFGYRVLAADIPLVVVPEARAVHNYEIDASRLIRDAEDEGFGDTVLIERHPSLMEDLPLRNVVAAAANRSLSWRRDVALGRAAVGSTRRGGTLALTALERGGQRRAWLWLLHRLSGAAYRAGVQRAIDAGHTLPALTRHATELDLDDPTASPTSPSIGQLVLTIRGRRLDAFHPHSGQWDVEEIILRAASALERTPAELIEPLLVIEEPTQ